MPKVSVVVPVYNVAAYLPQCFESLRCQTLEDIEIIFVDDASTDDSATLLSAYAAEDSRARVITHPQNRKIHMARKTGTLASCGEYIMYLDPDDELLPNACEIALETIQRENVDFAQLGAEVVNRANLSESRVRMMRNTVMSDCGRIDACESPTHNLIPYLMFDNPKRPFCWTMWGKIFRSDVCRLAMEQTEDAPYPGEDAYEILAICCHATTFFGCKTPVYRYSHGIGVTGGRTFSLKQFEKHMMTSRLWEAARRYVENVADDNTSAYHNVLDDMYRMYARNCLNKWYGMLPEHLQKQGYELYEHAFGDTPREFICALAHTHWVDRAEVARKLQGLPFLQAAPRPADKRLVIAAYYWRLSNGGAERVVAELCNLWAAQCDLDGNPLYQVVCITDEPDKLDDESTPIQEYALDSRVERATLPSIKNSVSSNYRNRHDAWQTIIDEYGVDIVVSSHCQSPDALWDLLSVKSHPSRPAFVAHVHSFSGAFYLRWNDSALMLTHLYTLCDGAVVMTQADAEFASLFAPRVRHIPNPMTFAPLDMPESTRNPGEIVWVGRISPEKRPLDAIRIMRLVVDRHPNARLFLVGAADDPTLETRVRELIERLGLQDNVVMTGFTPDAERYYRSASVFLSTSAYEGFPTTTNEAAAHAVPIAEYEMPYLTFSSDERGLVTARQNDVSTLADQVIALLDDPQRAAEIGREGREKLREIAKFDIATAWNDLLHTVARQTPEGDAEAVATGHHERMLIEQITINQNIAKNGLRGKMQREIDTLQRDIDSTNNRLQHANEQLQAAKATAKQQAKEATARQKQLEADKAALADEISSITRQLQLTTQQLEADKAALRDELSDTANQLKHVNDQLQRANDQLQHTTQQLDSSRQQVKQLQDTSSAQSAALKAKDHTIDKLHKQHDDLLQSNSWRVGRAVTAPMRWVKRKAKRS